MLQGWVGSQGLNTLRYDGSTVKVVYHRSRVIFSWNSDFLYNTIGAFFWIIRSGPKTAEARAAYKRLVAQGWEKDPADPAGIRNLRLGWRVYTRVTKIGRLYIVSMEDAPEEPTVMVISGGKALGKKTFINVVVTGPTDLARAEVERFLSALHKRVRFEERFLEERRIYSEFYVRYKESFEPLVAQALELLYRVFGDQVTENRRKAHLGNFENVDLDISEGYDVFLLKRAALYFGGRIDIKTYRPKEFNHPARSVYDHPKAEAVVYYEKIKHGTPAALEALAVDLLASVITYAAQKAGVDVSEVVTGESVKNDFSRAWAVQGAPNARLLRTIKAREYRELADLIAASEPAATLIKDSRVRAIVELLATRAATRAEIEEYLRALKAAGKIRERGVGKRTVQALLSRLVDAGVIYRWRTRPLRTSRKKPRVAEVVKKGKKGPYVKEKELYATGGSRVVYVLNVGLIDEYVTRELRVEALRQVPAEKVLFPGDRVRVGGRVYEFGFNSDRRLGLYYVKRDGSLSSKWFKDLPAKVPVALSERVAVWFAEPAKVWAVEPGVYFVIVHGHGAFIELGDELIRLRSTPGAAEVVFKRLRVRRIV